MTAAAMLRAMVMAMALLAAVPLRAELTRSSEDGFTVHHALTTAAVPFVVYRTLTAHIDEWWNPDHSWSGDAANLYVTTDRGGCFCERLPNGGRAEHLRIIYLAPGSEIRFEGALGPLQAMAVKAG